MLPKLSVFATAQNRSFVKQSKGRESGLARNSSYTGVPNRSFVKESLSSRNNKGTMSREKTPAIPHIATQSTTTSEDDEDDNDGSSSSVCSNSEPSSFWNDWAAELLQREEVEYEISSSNSPPKVKHDDAVAASNNNEPFYDDPSFVMNDETQDEDELLLATLNQSSNTSIAAPRKIRTTNEVNDSVLTGSVPKEEEKLKKGTNFEAGTFSSKEEGKIEKEENAKAGTIAAKESLVPVPTEKKELDYGNGEANESTRYDEAETEVLQSTYEFNGSFDTMEAMRLGNATESMAASTTRNEFDDAVSVARATTMKARDQEGVGSSSPTPSNQDDEFEEQSMFIPVNSSINTFAAMNISQATMNITGLNKTNYDADLSFSNQAMEFSNAAAELLQATKHGEALELFQKSADCYERLQDKSVLAAVNAAGCYRNMSSVSRMLERYDEGADYLRKAEELYVRGREAVEIKSSEAILTLDGKPYNNDDSQALNNTVSCYTTYDDESMCLDAMILETLQNRANFHIKYQDDVEQAVECHEQCLTHLIHLSKLRRWDEQEDPVREQGVTFVQLSKEQHTVLLVKSLESLGGFYRALAAGSTYTACMIVFEDALDILQIRQEQEEPNNDALILSVAQILRYLSEIYFERRELDRAVDALHDSTAVKLTASGAPCPEALEVMDQMGAANEQMNNWEKALSCYQQTLFARCKYYGNTHFCVAKSLVNVARVMERKGGSTEESVELYKAANAIFALQISSNTPDLGEDVEAILRLIPTVICQGRYEQAVGDLNMCLAMAEDKNSGLTLDKAQIYFDLGRAYKGMKNYKMATESLMNAIKEVGDVNDEDVFTLLQHVEFQQRDSDPSRTMNTSIRSFRERGTVQDPTLSFQNITFQLQGEPSVYIFEDDASAGEHPSRILTEEEKTEIELHQTNPRYDILYQSFSQEPGPRNPAATKARKVERVPFGRDFIARILPPSKNPDGVTSKAAATRSQLRAKLAKRVAKMMERLKEPKSQRRPTTKYKNIRVNCFKMCQGKPSVEKPTVPFSEKAAAPVSEKAGDETIEYSSIECSPMALVSALSEIASRCFSPVGDRNVSKPTWFFVHNDVKIEEEEEGFASHLVSP